MAWERLRKNSPFISRQLSSRTKQASNIHAMSMKYERGMVGGENGNRASGNVPWLPILYVSGLVEQNICRAEIARYFHRFLNSR